MEKTKTKENYYVFLDIDGTLWDAKFAYGIYGDIFNYISYPTLKKDSINAVNLLLRSLEEKFNTKLVITSRKREYMSECIDYLQKNGLKYDKPIFCLPFGETYRGARIVGYMQEQNNKPEHLSRPQNLFSKLLNAFIIKGSQNYVVLEDDFKLIKSSIPSRRLIFSNHQRKSITTKQVENYLKTNKIPVAKNEKTYE